MNSRRYGLDESFLSELNGGAVVVGTLVVTEKVIADRFVASSPGSNTIPSFSWTAEDDSGLYLEGGAGTVSTTVGGSRFWRVRSAGAQAANTALDALNQIRLSGDISPAALTTDTDDYNPTGASSTTTFRLDATGPVDLTGIAGGTDGRIVILTNIGVQVITLKHDDPGSVEANRFLLLASGDVPLGPNGSLVFRYDATSSRWRSLFRG